MPVNRIATLQNIHREMTRQTKKWGEQNHADGTGHDHFKTNAKNAKAITDHGAKIGALQWWMILDEEVQEAFAEDDPDKLREELVQVAAVAASWIECLDRRKNGSSVQ